MASWRVKAAEPGPIQKAVKWHVVRDSPEAGKEVKMFQDPQFPPDRLFLGGSPWLVGLPAGDGHREKLGSRSQLRQQLEVATEGSSKKEKSREQLAPQQSRHPCPMSITAPDPRGQPVPCNVPLKGENQSWFPTLNCSESLGRLGVRTVSSTSRSWDQPG